MSKKILKTIVVCWAALALVGCAGQATQLHLKDKNGAAKEITYPKGTLFGGVSREQATVMAQIIAESHNYSMEGIGDLQGTSNRIEKSSQKIEGSTVKMEGDLQKLDESSTRIEDLSKRIDAKTTNVEKSTQKIDEATKKIDGTTGRIEGSTGRIEGSVQKVLENSGKNFDTSLAILNAIEKLAKKQGTGEVTIFFPVGSALVSQGSLEYQRVVNFVDYVARESHGRKVLFLSVGSASAFGDHDLNERLAKERAEAPVKIIDKYLVNTPHEFFKIYGTGDAYSPKDVSREEHQKYQHTRMIAVYETSEFPKTPEEPNQPLAQN